MNKRIVFIDISGEVLLDVFKKAGGLPQDTKLIRIAERPLDTTPCNAGLVNDIRLIVESESFNEVREGERIPRYNLAITRT